MINLTGREWLILTALLALSFIPCFTGALRMLEIAGGHSIMPTNPRVTSNPLPAVVHITSSIVFCVFSITQFLPSLRNRFSTWHRATGRLVVIAGILSAASGLWMTHYYPLPIELQGQSLYGFRMLVGVSMMACLVLGLCSIRHRRVTEHRRWMIRAYALGLGAGTQVIITIPWLITMGEPIGSARDALMIMAWLLNLVIAETIIQTPPKPPAAARRSMTV